MEKINDRIRLDLFKLCDPKDNTDNWLLAKGENLKVELRKLIEKTELSNKELVEYLIRKLNISTSSAIRLVHLKREWYPLIFIVEMANLTNSSKYDIQDKIEFLKSLRPPVVEYRAVKKLTINLCKIVGAHAADGTLNDSYIAITDNYKSNIVALINWFSDFAYYPKLSKIGENEYGTKFHSRIISRYLTKFFGFPSGCKQYNVAEPELIKKAPIEFRKAFALGALTFEAGVGIKSEVEFCVVSKAFRDSIVEILQKLNVPHKSMEKQSSGYWRFTSNALTKEQALEWMELFEPNTEKWFKLNDYVTGFSKEVNSFQEAASILNSIYPRKTSNKVILTDVLLALKELKATHRYEIAEYLTRLNNLQSYGGKWAHSLKHYLDILKRANMISVKKGEFGKKKSFGTIIRDTYIFNENMDDWRLPERKNYL